MTREELCHWRLAQGLTQTQAESLFDIKSGGRTWRRWENGEHQIPKLLEYALNGVPRHALDEARRR